MKTIVFANGSFAFPAIQLMAQQGLLLGLCAVESESEESQQLKMLAMQFNIPVLLVNTTNYKQKIKKYLQEVHPELVLVMTFPFKIPKDILTIPKRGFYNFHYARLPEYRGAQPVFWEIVNQESLGAVSVHKMDEGLDSGPLLIMEQVPINPEATYGMHVINLANAGIVALQKLYAVLLQGLETSLYRIQDETKARIYKKPALNDVIINWEEQTTNQIRALVKACNPWNKGAFTFFRGRNLKITEVTRLEGLMERIAPGTIIKADQQNGLIVQCKDASLRIDIVYMEEGFLTGIKLIDLGLKQGDSFSSRLS